MKPDRCTDFREEMTAKIQGAPLISRTSAEMWDYESPEKKDSRIHVIK